VCSSDLEERRRPLPCYLIIFIINTNNELLLLLDIRKCIYKCPAFICYLLLPPALAPARRRWYDGGKATGPMARENKSA
jgi:hypothetical protein